MQDNNEESVNRNGHALKHGLILGIVSAIITYILYAVDVALLADWKVLLFFIVIVLTAVIVFGIKYRNLIGGYMSFGDGFMYSFIFFAIAGLIGAISSILLYEVIDPDLRNTLTKITIDKSVAFMEGFGVPSSEIDKAIVEMERNQPANYTAIGVLKSYGILLIVYAVISLIVGLIIKKNEPIEDI